MVAEHYEIDFEIIFHIKTAENVVAEHYEREFDGLFHFKRLNTWLQSTMNEDRLIGPVLMAMKKNWFN